MVVGLVEVLHLAGISVWRQQYGEVMIDWFFFNKSQDRSRRKYSPNARDDHIPGSLVQRPCRGRRRDANLRTAALQNSSAEEILMRAVVGDDLQAD